MAVARSSPPSRNRYATKRDVVLCLRQKTLNIMNKNALPGQASKCYHCDSITVRVACCKRGFG